MATTLADPAAGLKRVQIAIFAKAPIPGLAKTRLIPVLGAAGSARLQRRLTIRALHTALQAELGKVFLWCAPDADHRFFRILSRATGVTRFAQVNGDLGLRMHMAFRFHCMSGPLLLIGTDCPSLTAQHLRQAATALLAGDDAVFFPAADGGYVLVGLHRPQAELFTNVEWSTSSVMSDTRERARTAGLRLRELQTLWDLDVPVDLERLCAADAAALGVQSKAGGRGLAPCPELPT